MDMKQRLREQGKQEGFATLRGYSKFAPLDAALQDLETTKKMADPRFLAKTEQLIQSQADPQKGGTQTIDVRSGLTGAAGQTAQAARAAGAGAASKTAEAMARIKQQARQQYRQNLGIAQQAQRAAQDRFAGALTTASQPTFAENLAQQAVTGAVQQGIGAGTTLATGGIGQAAGLSPDMLRAAQGVA